jgi:hypothetical protein
MKTNSTYRWTAILGILLFILVLSEINFYFIFPTTASGTPPSRIILLRILIDLFICIGLLGFFSGFKQIISDYHSNFSLLGNFIFALGLALAIGLFTANSIQAGSVWIAGENPVDPTVVGHGGEGALLLYGPVNRLLMGTILLVSGTVSHFTHMLPKWTGWLAFVAGFYNLAFIPTLFYMTVPNDFFSTNGWNIPIAAAFFFIWMLIVSLYLLRKKSPRT